MHISKRAQEIQESPIRKLKPYADQAKSEGVRVYLLILDNLTLKPRILYGMPLKMHDKKYLSTVLLKAFLI